MFEQIWSRIIEHEGQTFTQIRGKEFTYAIIGQSLKLSTTNQLISKETIKQAINLLPVQNTVPLQHLRAPSYLFAILTDKRIVEYFYLGRAKS